MLNPRFLLTAILSLLVSVDLPAQTASTRPDATEKPPIHLGVGEQRLLRIEGLSRYSLGNEGLVRVLSLPKEKSGQTPSGEALLLKGIGAGETDLWVWKKDGATEIRRIEVSALPGRKGKTEPLFPARLSAALDLLQETEIIASSAGVVLRGEIHQQAEANRVATLKRGFPNEVRDETTLSATLSESLKSQVAEWISQRSTQSKLLVTHDGGRPLVTGSIEDPSTRATLEKELLARFPSVEVVLDSLPDSAPTIHFRVFLLELKKSRFGSFGLTWPAFQEGAFRVTRWGIEEALQLDLLLQTLEGEGSARILSNPELSVRAPGEAELFAGGEVPIASRTRFGSNITFRPYGLSLKLNVTHASGDRVRLEVATEVSHLDLAIGSGDIPGFQSNRMRTQVDARFKEPLLLSGLLQQGVRENAKGLPWLRQIPILGSLFGSEDYLRERSELVAILLPLIRPPKAPLEQIVRLTPKGPLPPPRQWLPPEEETGLRQSEEYPWNALK